MRYIIIILMVLFVMSCSVSVIDNFPHPENYPEVDSTYIIMYGDPNFIETVTYDNGTSVTRAIWDGTNADYQRSITAGDIVTASFVDGSVTPDDYAQLGTEQEVIQPYIDLLGVMDSSTIYYYDHVNDDDYYEDYNLNDIQDFGEPDVAELNFRGIDLSTGSIDYVWTDLTTFNMSFVYLEHLVTLQDGTKIYGVSYALTYSDGTFTEISL